MCKEYALQLSYFVTLYARVRHSFVFQIISLITFSIFDLLFGDSYLYFQLFLKLICLVRNINLSEVIVFTAEGHHPTDVTNVAWCIIVQKSIMHSIEIGDHFTLFF